MTDALTIQDAQFDPAAPIASRPVAERSRTQFGALFHAFAPGLAVGLGAFALACLILIAVNLTLIRVGADLSAGATPRALDIGMILVFNAALAAGCIGWARVSAPPDWRDALGLIHAPVDSRVLGMMVLALVAGIAWVEVLAAIVGRAQFQSATSVLVFEGGPLLRFFTALAVVVAAPVAEEMFFRGFLQGRLRQGFGPVLAIGLTTIAFSLVHYSGNLLHPLGVAVMSIGCGVLRERTGSLWPAILLHAVNNSLVVVALVLRG